MPISGAMVADARRTGSAEKAARLAASSARALSGASRTYSRCDESINAPM
jgi:hypothetical protein